MSNLKQIGRAVVMYVDDHDSRMPLAEAWQDATYAYVRNTAVYSCPDAINRPSYAFNALLSGLPRKQIAEPAEAPAVFDSYLAAPNASDWLQSFARRHEWFRKKGWGNVVFADGHARKLQAAPPVIAGLRPPEAEERSGG